MLAYVKYTRRTEPQHHMFFYLWFIVFVRTGAILLKQCYLTQVCKRPSNS